jgi:hypothetical protein
MSIWTIINVSAWTLCGFFALLMIVDIIKVEIKRYTSERKG